MGERSEMSMVSQMSMVEAPTTVAGRDEGMTSNSKLFICAVLLLLVILGVLFMTGKFFGKETELDDDTDSADKGSGDPSGPSGPSGPPYVKTETTKSSHSTTPLTTMSTSTSPTPDDFVEPEPTKRPVPKKPESTSEDILLCTISYMAIFNIMYPDDGLCDLVFYTAIRYDEYESGFAGAFETSSFEVFKDRAKRAVESGNTGYGASFDYRYGEAAAAQMMKYRMLDLWKSGVYHYGVLHIWENYAELTNSNPNLDILNVITPDTKMPI